MIDPNRGNTQETLTRLKEASYERTRIELLNSVKMLLTNFNMTWDDLANKLQWKWNGLRDTGRIMTGDQVRDIIGGDGYMEITIETLNDIAHCYSAEAYIIFRPRPPFTKT